MGSILLEWRRKEDVGLSRVLRVLRSSRVSRLEVTRERL